MTLPEDPGSAYGDSEAASFVCVFCLSVSACQIVHADPSLRYPWHVTFGGRGRVGGGGGGRGGVKQPPRNTIPDQSDR